jgi:hypothetical protein
VSNWKIDRWERPGHPDHIEIHDEHYERSAEIDDGDLLVEHEVESDSYGGGSRTVRCRIPAIEIVALLRLNGYGVDAPSQPSPGAPAGTEPKPCARTTTSARRAAAWCSNRGGISAPRAVRASGRAPSGRSPTHAAAATARCGRSSIAAAPPPDTAQRRRSDPMRENELRLLASARHAVDHGFEGVCVKGPTRKVAIRLEIGGLLKYVGGAYEEDGNPDREWPSYAPTAAGLAALASPARAPGSDEGAKR